MLRDLMDKVDNMQKQMDNVREMEILIKNQENMRVKNTNRNEEFI